MTETRKPDAPQPQAELSEEQLHTAVGSGDGRYTVTALASQISTGGSNIKDGTSNIRDGSSNT